MLGRRRRLTQIRDDVEEQSSAEQTSQKPGLGSRLLRVAKEVVKRRANPKIVFERVQSTGAPEPPTNEVVDKLNSVEEPSSSTEGNMSAIKTVDVAIEFTSKSDLITCVNEFMRRRESGRLDAPGDNTVIVHRRETEWLVPWLQAQNISLTLLEVVPMSDLPAQRQQELRRRGWMSPDLLAKIRRT